MHRRDFLRNTAALSGLALVRVGSNAWAAQNPASGPERLVVVFLRGAVDGLNVVVPHADKEYYAIRPSIAIAPPGHADGAIELDGHFGLHPQLAALLPLWKERSLAFVHACGSPDPSRSHFEAQAYMESGTPGLKITTDGWLNRVLAALPGQHPPTEAVNFGPTMPRILHGPMPVASLPSAGGGGGRTAEMTAAPAFHAAFDEMYSGDDALSVAYRQGQNAHARLMSDLEQDMTEAAGGAPSPVGFAQDVEHFCKLARRDPTIQVGFFALSGWDTHVRQGGAHGALANHLRQLGEGLVQFQRGLGPDGYARTVILVVSEFGRTARENGNAGTDHGHGNAMWVMGGPVRGGKVYGEWPTLAAGRLHEDRDLAMTTDFRTVAGSVLAQHMKLSSAAIARVFPGAPAGKLSLLA
ncbi:MAG: DUF1501 domain-containing protein [Alphaproteobacteria bacterium]|nr:DUF1501 domain-containing protein [Alphaproteobacteria bacterium]